MNNKKIPSWAIGLIAGVAVAVVIGIFVANGVRLQQKIDNDPGVQEARTAKEAAESRLAEAIAFHERVEQHSNELQEQLDNIDTETAWLQFCVDELYKLNDKETLTDSDKWWMDFYLKELQEAGVVTEINRK